MYFAFIVLAIFSAFGKGIDSTNMDITRHHPSRVLSLLIGTCRKHEEACHLSTESTANFLTNIIELILNFDAHYDEQLLFTIEKLSKDLEHCKDALCVTEFEKSNGKLFEHVIQKAGKILSSVPEVEKFAWEKTILQPPPYF